jgi:uncharacterized membrane protein YgcG
MSMLFFLKEIDIPNPDDDSEVSVHAVDVYNRKNGPQTRELFVQIRAHIVAQKLVDSSEWDAILKDFYTEYWTTCLVRAGVVAVHEIMNTGEDTRASVSVLAASLIQHRIPPILPVTVRSWLLRCKAIADGSTDPGLDQHIPDAQVQDKEPRSMGEPEPANPSAPVAPAGVAVVPGGVVAPNVSVVPASAVNPPVQGEADAIDVQALPSIANGPPLLLPALPDAAGNDPASAAAAPAAAAVATAAATSAPVMMMDAKSLNAIITAVVSAATAQTVGGVGGNAQDLGVSPWTRYVRKIKLMIAARVYFDPIGVCPKRQRKLEESASGVTQNRLVVVGGQLSLEQDDPDVVKGDLDADDFQQGCAVFIDMMTEMADPWTGDRRDFFRAAFLMEFTKKQIWFFIRNFMRVNATKGSWATLLTTDNLTMNQYLIRPAAADDAASIMARGTSQHARRDRDDSGGGGGGHGDGGGGSRGGGKQQKRVQTSSGSGGPHPDNFCYPYVIPCGTCSFPDCKMRHKCAACGGSHTATECETKGTYDRTAATTTDNARRVANGTGPRGTGGRKRRRN